MLRTEQTGIQAGRTPSRYCGSTGNEKKNIGELLHERCPGLLKAVRRVIEASEYQYCAGVRNESFLWQHTVYVASMAMKLAYLENADPLLPVVAALFHDCGKFENGIYHAGRIPEEVKSAEIAETLMARGGFFSGEEISTVRGSLLALHNDGRKGDIHTRIVNDADYLVKAGHMGFANFFEKSVLRGMVIRNSILKVMSKELTYAASLETRMLTRSGRKLARKKAAVSISLFRNYLEELRTTGICDYEIRETSVPGRKGRTIPLFLVLPGRCGHCRNPLAAGFGRARGVKRDRLVVKVSCPVCNPDNGYRFSFCLPELEGAQINAG